MLRCTSIWLTRAAPSGACCATVCARHSAGCTQDELAKPGLHCQPAASSHLCPQQQLGSAGLQHGHQRAEAPAAGSAAGGGQPQHPGLSNLLHELHLAHSHLRQTRPGLAQHTGGAAQDLAQQQEPAALPADWAPEAGGVTGSQSEGWQSKEQAAAAAGIVMKAQAPQLPVSEAAAQGPPLMQVTLAVPTDWQCFVAVLSTSQHCRTPVYLRCPR